jgi:hypothetical protein
VPASERSENRKRFGALDHHPCSTKREADLQDALHGLPALQDRVMHIMIERFPICIGHETGKAWIPKTPSMVSPKSKPDGRTAAEVHQKAEHIFVTTV